MKLLLTGANGLVGHTILTEYADQHEFFAVTRRPASAGTWIETDLASDFDTSQFPKDLDAIICLAQSNRYRELPDGAADLIDVNVAGVVRILQYAASLNPKPHVIMASTGDVYGRSKGEPLHENSPFFQHVGGVPGLYPLSRKLAEDYATSFAVTYGLQLSIVRLFHIYGATMPDNALIYRLAENIRAGNPIRMEGEAGIFLNPTYVTDVADAILRLANTTPKIERDPVEAYNIAARESVSLRQIVDIIAQHLGTTPNIEVQPPKPDTAAYITPSTDKLAAHYGDFDTVSFRDGIKLSISVG